MNVISLQSGSNGNCFYVETGDVRLLFDAGISGRQAEERLANHGRDIRAVDGLFISHDHNDHSRSMGIFHRKYGIPIYVTKKTLEAAGRYQRLGPINDVRFFDAGSTYQFNHVTVETYSTPHDSADGVVFVVDDGERRLGILTDLGHVFDELHAIVSTLDATIIESNYDPEMLAQGPYPPTLKRRIGGPRGHISNVECAELLYRSGDRLAWACLGHLSGENNLPQRVLETHQSILGDRIRLHVASRHEASDILEI